MPAHPITPGESFNCISRVVATLQSEVTDLPCPTTLAMPADPLLEKLPSWIARCGSLIEGKNVWIYCEPRAGKDSDPSGQVLIRLPAGRYLVDTYDVSLHSCIARESAAGNPLVIALVSVPGPFLLWIRPIESGEATPQYSCFSPG